ncbi:MAG: hypothetical protein ACOCP4_00710 [Candidatus Woesearchaeota archaeon]
MENIVFNITHELVYQKHISWTVGEDGDTMILYEIVENYYPHPQAPDDALISKIEFVERKRVSNEIEKAPLKILKNALDNINCGVI